MKRAKTIPTIVGIIILFLGLVAGVYLSGKVNFFSPKASSDCSPNNLQVTNLTHNSFDISFVTDIDCSAQVVADGRNFFDVRQSQTKITRKTHYFRISNIKSEQNYNFAVTSGGQDYSLDSYQVKTGKTPSGQLPSSNLAWGKVLENDGSPSQDAILYFNLSGASPLSAFVGNDGRWNISLAFSLSTDRQSWFKPQADVSEEIIVMSANYPPTVVNSNTSRNDPVPDIILGKNQDISPIMSPTIAPSRPPSLNPTSSTISSRDLTIDNPKEGESVTSSSPDFFGHGLAGSTISLSLEPVGSTGQLTTPSSGTWHWSPSNPLAPASYTIKVVSLGLTVSRQFQVITSDFGLAFSASSSAKTITPTIEPTPTPTTEPTPVPTTPVKKTLPSTSSGVPTTGNSQLTFAMIVMGFIIILTSIKLFKL
ncbi:MAG: hypothetical protein WCV93_04930 [Candidatus Shapirobacteria bacterium]|jgi:hypothetical protein